MSDIAINPVTRRVQFTGNTGTGPFAFTFNVLNSSDIAVYKNTTLLTLTADYTVTIAANGTGSVTLQSGQAVISSDYVTIIGGRNLERTTDFVTAGDLLASSLNEQLDSNVIMSQQLDESFGRALSVSPGDVDVSMTLPSASSRANQVVAFTSTGAVTTTNLNDLPELTVDKLNVDNITLDGNTISTTDSNGNLILTPNGTGDVVVSGDLVVNGTTTTIHSTVVDIADKNITIAYGSSDAAAANGAGITVDGADATMNYYSTPDGWEFNKAVTVGYTGVTPQDLGGVLNVYSSSSSVPGMVIKSSGTSVDPKIQFEYSNQIWTVGQDSSSDDFKIINGTNLNSSAEIHINTDGDVALGGVSHYSNYELSVPQRVAIRSGSAVAGIDFAASSELVFDGNVGGTNGSFAKFRFASSEADKMVIDGTTVKLKSLAKLGGSEISISDDLKFADDKKAVFGDSTDLSIYFDATANKSYISHTGSGDYPVLEFNTDGYDMRFLGDGYFMIRATPSGDVKLYHAGSPKLATSASGVVITGSITADSYANALSIPDGSSSAPSLTNTGNTNTGLFFPANNQVGISASASEIVNISTTGVKITPFSGTDALVLNNNDTSIGDNNAIARIIATADDPTADQEGAEILFLSAGAWSTDNYPTEIIFRTDNSGSLTNRMVVGSTGVDVTGTVTADGLTVDNGSSGQSKITISEGGVNNRNLVLYSPALGGTSSKIAVEGTTASLDFVVNNGAQTAIRIGGSTGDISFYEDTGTTPKFFWDASAENLNIGAVSSQTSYKLHITGTAGSDSGDVTTRIEAGTVSSNSAVNHATLDLTARAKTSGGTALAQNTEIRSLGDASGNGGTLAFYTDNSSAAITQRMVIDSSGSVGIGATSISGVLTLQKNQAASSTAGTGTTLTLNGDANAGNPWEIFRDNGVTGDLVFSQDASGTRSEVIRLDSSGRVGIGTSSPTYALDVETNNSGGLISSFVNTATSIPQGVLIDFPNATPNATNRYFLKMEDSTSVKAEINTTGGGYFMGDVGIGTSSPNPDYGSDTALEISGASSPGLVINDTGQASKYGIHADSNDLKITYGTGALATFQNDGKVGIGTSSPSAKVMSNVNTFTDADKIAFKGYNNQAVGVYANFQNTTTGTGFADGFRLGIDDSENAQLMNGENTAMTFATSATEAMRLDASGNLLVGKTSTNTINTVGHDLTDHGEVMHTTDGGTTMYLNRKTSDGTIVDLRKDGSTVGSIGAAGGDLLIYSTEASHGGLRFGQGYTFPVNNTGATSDGAIDLGASFGRFDDIYATNGTIQTSDRNEKQDIAELSDAEQRVAVAAKGLLRKFRWRDAVAEKGDEARTHFGIIAQDLQAAFAAEGLDAGGYAMFISSTWTDEETGEERTRMGVRYSELLAFIIAAI